MQAKRTKTPANLIPMLRLAAKPGARLILVSGTAFILNGKKHIHMREAIYKKVLLEEGWITHPRPIASDLAESSVTREGYTRLSAIDAHNSKYTQLMFAL
jgi:hypothetical protein